MEVPAAAGLLNNMRCRPKLCKFLCQTIQSDSSVQNLISSTVFIVLYIVKMGKGKTRRNGTRYHENTDLENTAGSFWRCMSGFQMGIISQVEKTREGWQFIETDCVNIHTKIQYLYTFLCVCLAEECRLSSFFFCLRTNIPWLLNIFVWKLSCAQGLYTKSSFIVEAKTKTIH